jgi:hypothetical protein
VKAVIVDFRDGHAAALRDDGCVVKIRDAGYKLGQVIELHERVQPRWRRTFFSLAAAAALLLSIGGAAYATPYGTVTLDADSSIQYTINMFDYVLDVQAENEEGEALLAELDIRQLRHRPVDSAITSAMQQLEQRRAPEDAALSVSVSADTRNERHTERLCRELERTVNEHMPIPAPESGNQPGMHSSVTEPTRPEDPVAAPSAFHPDNKTTPNLQPDRAGNTGIESTPQEPQAGQLPNENGAPTADTPAERNPPDRQREQDKETGVADVGEGQYPMHTEDSAAALPAPEGSAHREDTPVIGGQAPEQSFGGQQPPEMNGGFGGGFDGGFDGGFGGGFGGGFDGGFDGNPSMGGGSRGM